MPRITIDGIDFHSEDLTESGKAQLTSLQFLETHMLKIKSEIAIYQAAQMTYVGALKIEIAKSGIQPLFSSTDGE